MPLLTVESFRLRFPEFCETKRVLVEAKLNQAARNLDATIWDKLLEDGHGQKTAHLLALSPEGVEVGLRMGGGANQRTVYQDEFEKLELIVGGSFRTELD